MHPQISAGGYLGVSLYHMSCVLNVMIESDGRVLATKRLTIQYTNQWSITP